MFEAISHAARHPTAAANAVMLVAKPLVDSVLESRLSSLKGKGLDPLDWLEMKIPEASFVMPETDLRTILATDRKNLKNVAQNIKRCTNSSRLAEVAFAFIKEGLSGEAFKKACENDMATVRAANFTEKAVGDSMQEILKKQAQLSIANVRGKRGFHCTVLGQLDIETIVSSPLGFWEYMLFAELRNASLGRKNGIEPYAHEKLIFNLKDASTKECEVTQCPLIVAHV